jgi:transcriptional regulator with XRE-family HTH domain
MPRTRIAVQTARADEARAVGQRLAAAREAAGLTQLAAARRLGVPQTAIAKLELGQRQLRFVEGIRLAGMYGVRPTDLAPLAAED